MTLQTTYTNARAQFAKLWDKVTHNQEIVIISRRGAEDVALISASELTGLIETSHLLRSPKNAKRLLAAMSRIQSDKEMPQTIDSLKKEIGLE